ncbi:hypothetical protein Tco_0243227 [Tanacetum coccineum]
MHTYVSRLKDTELETLIATYDIPLDLRPRLPDPNFRMINLPVGDTTIGIYSKIFDSSDVMIPFSSFLLVVLKYFKVHISQLVPLDKVPTSFNQNHVDQLKAHIVKLHDIQEGVLVRFGLSRVWRNPMCDPVLRRSDNTVMSIYDFLCMPSLDKLTVREEPHGLDTSILGRVVDRTTSPAPAGTGIPYAFLEEIAITRPNHKVVTKADHAAKRKASTGPEISTNRDGSKFAMEGIESLNDVSQGEHINVIPLRTFDPSIGLDVIYPLILLLDKEVEAHAELSRGVRRVIRASFHASHAPDAQPLDADVVADEIASDGNVDPYYEAQVGNIAGDVLERDLLPIIHVPYYIFYPYVEGSGSETALDRFPTPVETHRLRELSSIELSDCISMLQCQLITHGSMLNARYNHSLRNKLSSWDKKHRKYRSERGALVIEKEKIGEELVETKSQLEHRERQAKGIQGSIASFFHSNFTPLVRRFLKSSEFNRAFASALNTSISVGVERGLRIDRFDEDFRELSQRVVGFIPDAKEKFDRVVATFPDTTFPFLDKMSRLIHAPPTPVDVAFGPGLLNQYGTVLPEQLLGCGLRART